MSFQQCDVFLVTCVEASMIFVNLCSIWASGSEPHISCIQAVSICLPIPHAMKHYTFLHHTDAINWCTHTITYGTVQTWHIRVNTRWQEECADRRNVLTGSEADKVSNFCTSFYAWRLKGCSTMSCIQLVTIDSPLPAHVIIMGCRMEWAG